MAEALGIVAGELPELPFLPELPERGAGADPAGRAIALLVDIWAEVMPSGWRISRRPTRDTQRANDFRQWDLDALEAVGGAGALKIGICGPLTLGAQLELPNGNRVVTDLGALADLTASLTEGLAGQLAEIQRRVPSAQLVLQLDEPDLAAVLAGVLPTASGFGTVRSVERSVVLEQLRTVLAVPGAWRTVLNAGRTGLVAGARLGVDAVALDLAGLGGTAEQLDPIGEWLSAGGSLFAGLVPAVPGRSPRTLAEELAPVRNPLRALGFSADVLADRVVLTPSGALADQSTERAVTVLRRTRDAARLLAERSEAGTELGRGEVDD
jgi:hypothetical protein